MPDGWWMCSWLVDMADGLTYAHGWWIYAMASGYGWASAHGWWIWLVDLLMACG
jgi:hypothetical protein